MDTQAGGWIYRSERTPPIPYPDLSSNQQRNSESNTEPVRHSPPTIQTPRTSRETNRRAILHLLLEITKNNVLASADGLANILSIGASEIDPVLPHTCRSL